MKKNNLLLIIKKKYPEIIIVFFLQSIFFLSLILINYTYLPPIVEKANNVYEYLSKQSYSEEKNMFGDNPLLISQNYGVIKILFTKLVLWSLLSYIIINGIIWFLCNKIFYKTDFKELKNYMIKFSILNLIGIVLIFTFFFQSIQSFFSILSVDNPGFNIISFILSLVLLYLIFILYILILKIKTKNLLETAFRLVIKKGHIILGVYLLNILIKLILILSFIFLIEFNLFLVTLIGILLVLSFVWSKLFLIKTVKKYVKV